MPADTSIYAQQRPLDLGGDPLDRQIKRFTLDEMQRKSVRSDRDAEVKNKLAISEAVGSDAITLDTVYRQALQANNGDKSAAMAYVQPIYSQVRSKWASMGHQIDEQFDPDKNFASIGQAKEVIQYLKTLQPEVKMEDAGGKLVPTNLNPNAGPVGPLPGGTSIAKTPKPGEQTEFNRLMSERDALIAANPNDQRIKDYDRVIASYKGGRGTDVSITNNQPGPMVPGKEGQNKIDETLVKTLSRVAQITQIRSQFKPEFQQLGTKLSNAWNAGKDTLGIGLTNKEKKDLDDFNEFRASSGELYAQTLKEMAGTALTEGEVRIHSAYLPKAGTGLFDGDSPRQLQTKVDRLDKTLKMAVARLSYMKRHGYSLEDGAGNPTISLDRMPVLINERGQELEKQLRAEQPNADEKTLQRRVRRQLGSEFGLATD